MLATKKAPESSADQQAPGSGRRKKLLLIAAPLLALVVGWYVLLGPAADGGEPAAAKKPEPGEVVSLQPITMNLADGRLLKVGLALQVVAEPSSGHGEVTGAVALDEAIAYLGGRTYAELVAPAGRQAAKEELSKRVAERYHHDVLEVYFTEFVMQ